MKLEIRRTQRNITRIGPNTRIPTSWKVIGLPQLRTRLPTAETAGTKEDRPDCTQPAPGRQHIGYTPRKDRRKSGML